MHLRAAFYYFFLSLTSKLGCDDWLWLVNLKFTFQAFIWLIILVLNSSQLVGMVHFTSQDACQGYLKIFFLVEYQWLQYSRHESAGRDQQDKNNQSSINHHFTLIRNRTLNRTNVLSEIWTGSDSNVSPAEIADQLVGTSVDWLALPPRQQHWSCYLTWHHSLLYLVSRSHQRIT